MKQIILLLILIYSPFCIAEQQTQLEIFQLSKAESTALRTDPRLQAAQARIDSSTASITAETQLPDPQLRLALLNLPMDSFDFNQEPMTQAFAGLKQSFPAGDTLAVKKSIAEAEVASKQSSLKTHQSIILRDLRRRWLNVYASTAELELVQQERQIMDAMIPAAIGAYRAGKGTQTEVVNIKLKLAGLNENEATLNGMQNESRAALSQWFDSIEKKNWPAELPTLLTTLPQVKIIDNPEVQELSDKIKISEEKVSLAQQAYKPTWGVEASYGYREGRADFLSMGITVSLPVFESTRQDHRVKASQAILVASKLDKQYLITELKTRLKKLQSSVTALNSRIKVYDNEILPELRKIQILSKNDFRTGKANFSSILQAQEATLKAERKKLLLSLERARRIIDILFIIGEERT